MTDTSKEINKAQQLEIVQKATDAIQKSTN